MFVSSGDDCKMIVWDCAKIGDDCTEGDGIDGPQELVFTHSGHRGNICLFVKMVLFIILNIFGITY